MKAYMQIWVDDFAGLADSDTAEIQKHARAIEALIEKALRGEGHCGDVEVTVVDDDGTRELYPVVRALV
jgi:hypothetical protein